MRVSHKKISVATSSEGRARSVRAARRRRRLEAAAAIRPDKSEQAKTMAPPEHLESVSVAVGVGCSGAHGGSRCRGPHAASAARTTPPQAMPP